MPSLGQGLGASAIEGLVGPAPSGLVLLTQMVASSGSPTDPMDHPRRPEHHLSRGLLEPRCRRRWMGSAAGGAGQARAGSPGRGGWQQGYVVTQLSTLSARGRIHRSQRLDGAPWLGGEPSP